MRRLSEVQNLQIFAEKTVEVPFCAEHLVVSDSWLAAWIWFFKVLVIPPAWVVGWFLAGIQLGQPLLVMVGMAPLFWFAIKLQQGGFSTKEFSVEMLDAKRVVFRNAAPAFASELSRTEWKRQFGEEASAVESAPRPRSDNPFA